MSLSYGTDLTLGIANSTSLEEALGVWIHSHGIQFVINYTLPQSEAQDQKIKTLWNEVLLDPTFAALTVQKHWPTIVIDPTSWDATYALFRDDITQVIDGPYKVDQKVADELGYTEDVNSCYDCLQDVFGDTNIALDLAEVVVKYFAHACTSTSHDTSPSPPSPSPAPAAPTPQSEPEPEPVIDIPPGANPIKAIYDIVSLASFQNPLSPKNKAIKKVNGFKLGDPNLGPLLHTCGRPSSYTTSTGHVEDSALTQVIKAHTMGALFSGIHDYLHEKSLEPFLTSRLLNPLATHKFARAIKLARMWSLSVCRLHTDVQSTILVASHGFLLPDTHRDIVTVQDSMQLTPDRLFAKKDEAAYLTLMSWGSLSPKLMRSKLATHNKYAKLVYEVFLPRDPAGSSANSGTSENAAAAETELIGLGTLRHFASMLYGVASISQGRRLCLADVMKLIEKYHGSDPQEDQCLRLLVRARNWTAIFESNSILKVKIGESTVNHPYGCRLLCDVMQEVGLMHPDFGALSGTAHTICKISHQLFPLLPESLVVTCGSLVAASLILRYNQNETSERVRSRAVDIRPAIRISDPASHGVIRPAYSATHANPMERERLRLIVIIQEAWLAIKAQTLTLDGKNRWVFASLPRHRLHPDSPGVSEGDQFHNITRILRGYAAEPSFVPPSEPMQLAYLVSPPANSNESDGITEILVTRDWFQHIPQRLCHVNLSTLPDPPFPADGFR
ncbi:hypothetical protein DXG01_013966 [Tephrocybe rancida]|nr:hypothetical protein DXG01_013966 [Tephrocybe rancida]